MLRSLYLLMKGMMAGMKTLFWTCCSAIVCHIACLRRRRFAKFSIASHPAAVNTQPNNDPTDRRRQRRRRPWDRADAVPAVASTSKYSVGSFLGWGSSAPEWSHVVAARSDDLRSQFIELMLCSVSAEP